MRCLFCSSTLSLPAAHLESSVLSLPARGLLRSPIGPFRFLNKNLETQTAKSGIQSCHSERLSDYFQKAFDTPFVIVALTGSGGGVVNLKIPQRVWSQFDPDKVFAVPGYFHGYFLIRKQVLL